MSAADYGTLADLRAFLERNGLHGFVPAIDEAIAALRELRAEAEARHGKVGVVGTGRILEVTEPFAPCDDRREALMTLTTDLMSVALDALYDLTPDTEEVEAAYGRASGVLARLREVEQDYKRRGEMLDWMDPDGSLALAWCEAHPGECDDDE